MRGQSQQLKRILYFTQMHRHHTDNH